MSFIECPPDSDFPLENLPYGVFSTQDNEAWRIGVAIGDYVLDVGQLVDLGLFQGMVKDRGHVLKQTSLNDFMAQGRPYWQETRRQLQHLLSYDNPTLQGDLKARVLVDMEEVTMHVPARIGDYTDFYSSLHHATNVGSMFRDPQNPLPPNWKSLPIGYHGRASSVVVSGTSIHRPMGQVVPAGGQDAVLAPSRLMDLELEVAFFIGGPPTPLGQRISMQHAEEHIFGFVLMNDWSARDIQKWEYFPLGPFVSKSLGTTISPWVVTIDALRPFLTDNFPQHPPPLPYLQHSAPFNFDLRLSVQLKNETSTTKICSSNFKYLYWTPLQQVVHHTTTGCNLNPGDLMGSGTISGQEEGEYGSLLELSWKGTRPLQLADGTTRTFLQDYDDVIITGFAQNETTRIGFGECRGQLLPAIPMDV